ncbi:hypothetical protein ACQ4PT_018813 [Festuca glaucescens]
MIGGWAEKELSCAAREVLLKANVQSVPTYPMSVFKLLPGVCQKMTTAVSNYWWGSSLDNHKIHWLRWEKLTRPKGEGGIGFRDFSLFNRAMLGKQGWRLMTRPDSLCARLLKGKYYPNADFLSATNKKQCSATWRAILHGREVLKKGIIWRVGPGDINVWEDNWIPGVNSFKPLLRLASTSVEKVQELFVPGTRIWDESKVCASLCAIDAGEVLKIRPSVRLEEDVLAWALEKHGVYSVRSAYRLLKQEQTASAMDSSREAGTSGDNKVWSSTWKLNVPPKIRVFWWRVLNNSLPSKAELGRRHVIRECFCEVCGDPEELLFHVMFQCPIARRFWGAAARYISKLLEDLASLKKENKVTLNVPKSRWSAPEPGWFKINSDAGFNSATCLGSAGVIVRDSDGAVKGALARRLEGVTDALTAEALAALEGLELAQELGHLITWS